MGDVGPPALPTVSSGRRAPRPRQGKGSTDAAWGFEGFGTLGQGRRPVASQDRLSDRDRCALGTGERSGRAEVERSGGRTAGCSHSGGRRADPRRGVELRLARELDLVTPLVQAEAAPACRLRRFYERLALARRGLAALAAGRLLLRGRAALARR